MRRDLLQPGRVAFNRGQFFEAHELWEDVWRGLVGDERTFVQGLIQIAAGLHHLQAGRRRPAAGLLAKGAEKVARCRPARSRLPAALGVDALLRDVGRILADPEAPWDPASRPLAAL